jgi:hypothetical protein
MSDTKNPTPFPEPGLAGASPASAPTPADQSHATNQPSQATAQPGDAKQADILQRIITELSPLSVDARRRIVDTVCTFFDLKGSRIDGGSAPASVAPSTQRPESAFRFSTGEPPSPKVFMNEKAPKTDIERVACLAFYLTHHRSTPHFKTRDIRLFNTEAGQLRFSNTAFAVTNATNAGFLIPSVKGSKQISTVGEQFVQALPDREAAAEVLKRYKRRRGGRHGREKSDDSVQS